MKRIHTTIFAPAILLFAGTSFATTWTVDDDARQTLTTFKQQLMLQVMVMRLL